MITITQYGTLEQHLSKMEKRLQVRRGDRSRVLCEKEEESAWDGTGRLSSIVAEPETVTRFSPVFWSRSERHTLKSFLPTYPLPASSNSCWSYITARWERTRSVRERKGKKWLTTQNSHIAWIRIYLSHGHNSFPFTVLTVMFLKYLC